MLFIVDDTFDNEIRGGAPLQQSKIISTVLSGISPFFLALNQNPRCFASPTILFMSIRLCTSWFLDGVYYPLTFVNLFYYPQNYYYLLFQVIGPVFYPPLSTSILCLCIKSQGHVTPHFCGGDPPRSCRRNFVSVEWGARHPAFFLWGVAPTEQQTDLTNFFIGMRLWFIRLMAL